MCLCGQRMVARGHPRHAALNDIIKRGIQSARASSVLEPVGVDRGDDKSQMDYRVPIY